MELYRYRSIKSAKRDLKNGTFHFSSKDELNDSLEGYIGLYWQGDKPAWEGLLKNYICSLHDAIEMFIVTEEEDYLWKRSLLRNPCAFDGLPITEIYESLGKEFLFNKEIDRITSLYGGKEYRCDTEEMHQVLQAIHALAFSLCINKHVERGCISKEYAQLGLTDSDFFERLRRYVDQLEKIDDENLRKMANNTADNIIADYKESMVIRFGLKGHGFAYGNKITPKRSDAFKQHRRSRNWMALQLEYPRMYLAQLKDMIYPDAFVVCFSGKNDDSAMWGNYADNHRGVCLIYDAEEINPKSLAGGIYDFNDRKLKPRKVEYGGEKLERNFFESLGLLPLYPVQAWLTGKDGTISKIINIYIGEDNESNWIEKYWENFKAKNYHKLKEWSHEDEYRINIDNSHYSFSEDDAKGEESTEKRVSRNIKYDLSILKGVIFGIRTTEYDKVMIIRALIKKGIADKVKYYQAYYNDENQKVEIHPKLLRLDDKIWLGK